MEMTDKQYNNINTYSGMEMTYKQYNNINTIQWHGNDI